MYQTTSPQEIIDAEQLRLLRIGYFVSAGLSGFFIPFGLLYAAMGGLVMAFPTSGKGPPPPAFLPFFFGAFGLGFAALGVAGLTLKLLCARNLRERRGRTLCFIAAGLALFDMPYGTVLGVFTFVVLSRPNVAHLFDPPRAGR